MTGISWWMWECWWWSTQWFPINSNKWRKCQVCVRYCEKWQKEICRPNWNFCRKLSQYSFHVLNMCCICQHFVPQILISELKETWTGISGDLIDTADRDNKFLNKITAMLHGVSCMIHNQNSYLLNGNHHHLKAKNFKSIGVKERLCWKLLFCDCQGTVHYKLIPEGKTVNKEMYIDILHHIRDLVRKKSHKKWNTNSLFPLHDNAPADWSVLLKDFLAKNNMTSQEHPPKRSWTDSSWFLPVHSSEMSTEGTALLWCYWYH